MKSRFILAALLLCSLCTLKAQQEPAPRKEFAVQLFARGSYIDYDFYGAPGIGVRYDKHCAFGGPLIPYLRRYEWRDSRKGIFLGYHFYPKWHFKRLSGHAAVLYQHESYRRHYYFGLTAGYGLDFRLLKNLYLDHTFSMGVDGIFGGRGIDSHYYRNFNLDFITMLQFGLRYDFVFGKRAD